MIRIVEGRSGSGKTKYITETLCEFAKSGHKNIIYLIPEQNSLESELNFLHLLGPDLYRNIKVASFTSLYNIVMTATGGFAGVPIDDGTRSIIMSVTLEGCASNLELYSKQAVKSDFINVALEAINEFKQCGITPDQVREIANDNSNGELNKKLRDLALIYEVYNANIKQSGIDPLDNDMRLEKRIAETNFFADYVVAVDGFTGFTSQQEKIIKLMMQAEDFYISLCLNPECDEELFSTVQRTKAKIIQIANEAGKKIASPKELTEIFRYKNDELRIFERNIYRISDSSEDIPVKNIEIAQGSDVYDECEYIAVKINQLALSNECRYKDINVVFRNSAKYSGVIDKVFDKFDIPYFMSKPQVIDTKPLIRLVVSILEYMVAQNDEKKLFSALKTGLLGIPDYTIAQLENYVFVWSIKGKQFFSEFKLNPQGYADKFSQEDTELLQSLNEAREKLITPILKMRESLTSESKTFTAKEISKAIYEYLVNAGIPEIIRKRAEDKFEFSEEEVRLWNMLMDILNKMAVSLGENQITVKRYYELFVMVIAKTDISDIPQTLDQVIISTADVVRFASPYAVFIVGAVNEEFPKLPTVRGVFSDTERKKLIDKGLPLYDSSAEVFYHEKFLVYNAVSAPSDKLFISYPTGDLTGKKCEPSTIVSEAKRIFPKIVLRHTQAIRDIDRIMTPKTALELYAKNYGTKTPFFDALGEYLKTSEYSEQVNDFGNSLKNTDSSIKNPKVSEMVFGKNKYFSPTQIEHFYKCRFEYFCNYGVHLKDRKKADFDKLIYGTIVHYILENLIREYIERDYRPFENNELDVFIEDLLKKYMEENLGGEEEKTEKFKHIYYRSQKRVKTIVEHILREMEQSKFKPVDTELQVEFGEGVDPYELTAKNGNKVSVHGIIDRVDIMSGEKGDFVRIVDYKSGGKSFSLVDVMNGINMQMLIYLLTLSHNGQQRYSSELIPAAVLYMKSDIGNLSLSDIEDTSKEGIEQNAKEMLSDTLKMNGIYVDDDKHEVICGMEKNFDPKNKKKKKFFISANSVLPKQLDLIFDLVESKIVQMSGELDNGSIPALPYHKKSGFSACGFCEYKDLCRRQDDDPENISFSERFSETIKKLSPQ